MRLLRSGYCAQLATANTKEWFTTISIIPPIALVYLCEANVQVLNSSMAVRCEYQVLVEQYKLVDNALESNELIIQWPRFIWKSSLSSIVYCTLSLANFAFIRSAVRG